MFALRNVSIRIGKYKQFQRTISISKRVSLKVKEITIDQTSEFKTIL